MYLAVLAAILGQGLLFENVALLEYGGLVWLSGSLPTFLCSSTGSRSPALPSDPSTRPAPPKSPVDSPPDRAVAVKVNSQMLSENISLISNTAANRRPIPQSQP